MTTQIIYHSILVTHIIGLTMMAGITLADYILFKQFWKQYAINKQKGIAINEAVAIFPMLYGISIILLIVSGVSMMALTNGVFGEQLWFRIKFVLVIIIIVNGLLFGRRLGVKLRKLLSEDISGKNITAQLLKVKNKLNLFFIAQIIIFIIIFSLSIFKFN